MDESQLLLSRLEDLIWDSMSGDVCFMGFLNEREAGVVSSYLNNRQIDYKLYGGYDNASRVYVALSGDENTEFPIVSLSIISSGKKELTHRDFLGSLMGLGIKRECIGDILLLSPKEAVVFVRFEIAEYITRELSKVGHESVIVSVYTGDRDSLGNTTEELRLIVTSMRIDNVVSACAGCSRSVASDLISSDKVFVNYLIVDRPSRMVSQGDVLSIRGYGKFVIGSQLGKTKRDRNVISVLHYI